MDSNLDQDSIVDSLQSVSRGAVVFMAGSAFSKVLGFGLTLVLTQSLGTALYGMYALGFTLLTILADLGTLGSERAILRFLPNESADSDGESPTLFLAAGATILGSTLLAVATFWLAPLIADLTIDSPLFVEVLRIFALLIPLHSLTDVILSVFRSQERLEYQVGVRDVFNPLAKLLSVAVAVALGASLFGVTAALAVTVIVVFAAAAGLFFRRAETRPTAEGVRDQLWDHFDFTLPLALKDIGGLIMTRIDVLMIGFLLTGPDVGIYNVAVLVSSVLLFPIRGINQLVPPILSGMYESGEDERLQDLYATTSRWGLTITILPAIGVVVFRETVLSVFGQSFTAGGASLAILCVGYLVKSAAGPSGYALVMTDNQYVPLFNQLLLATLNLVLNYVLILRYGIVGAAIATATTKAVVNQLRVVELWYLEGYVPYEFAFVKPLLAGALTAALLGGVTFVLNGWFAAVVGAVLGTLVFCGALYGLGLDTRDERFVRSSFERLSDHL